MREIVHVNQATGFDFLPQRENNKFRVGIFRQKLG